MKTAKMERDLQLIRYAIKEMIEMLDLLDNSTEVLMNMDEQLVTDFYNQLIKTNLFSKAHLNTKVIIYRNNDGKMVTEYCMGGIHEDIIAEEYGPVVISTIGEELKKNKIKSKLSIS